MNEILHQKLKMLEELNAKQQSIILKQGQTVSQCLKKIRELEWELYANDEGEFDNEI